MLITTKLYIPPLPAHFVPRPRLLARLCLPRPITLLTAPPGCGKTTLLAELGAACPERTAWVSLDRDENDPARFWACLAAALPVPLAAELVAGLHTNTVSALINAVSALPDPITLILDDYHLIETPAIHTALATLVDRLPPTLRLVIATRADPPLPLARWRVRGHLHELRAADLAFTPAEAAAFLRAALGPERGDLDPAAVEALHQRTEGWIAGLHLAALAAQEAMPDDPAQFLAAYSGAHHYVLDYLRDEVLAGQPEDVRAFLAQTAILRRLSGPLCDAITGRDDSGALLADLARANVFLTPLDGERRWYRYHGLFADALRAEPFAPPDPATLHHRAALWYQAQGMTDDAQHHREHAERATHAAPYPLRRASGLIEPLSERELDVLRWMVDGLTNQEIADRLFISIKTVKKHGTNIYEKLAVTSRTQAVIRAQQLGLCASGQ